MTPGRGLGGAGRGPTRPPWAQPPPAHRHPPATLHLPSSLLFSGWRYSLAGAGVPALVLLVGSAFLPDTPASLTSRGHPDAALAVLQKVRGAGVDVSEEYADIKMAVAATAAAEAAGRGAIWRRKYRPELACVLLCPVFQQVTGINSIMFYAPVLFGSLGSDQKAALLNTVVVGAGDVGGGGKGGGGVGRAHRLEVFEGTMFALVPLAKRRPTPSDNPPFLQASCSRCPL